MVDLMILKTIEPRVFYVGTPVVLISSLNPDGTTNIAPMSSAWWLDSSAMLGLGGRSQTAINLTREREGVLNIVQADLVGAVDRIAMGTGVEDVPEYKKAKGYEYVPKKFAAAGLTPTASELVRPDRVRECQIQLEVVIDHIHGFGEADSGAVAFDARVVRSHVDADLIVPGTDAYIDPEKWDPLIMKFCEFYGKGSNLAPSQLATGWAMPPLSPVEA